MNFVIPDNHHNLKLTLQSNGMGIPSLEVFINDSSTPYRTYTSSSVNSPYIYNIPFSDYTVGDVITKCRLIQDSPVLPWQTHEGVTVLVDGVEVANLNYANSTTVDTNCVTYTTKFKEGTHDIQAFYVGNDEYNMSMTDKLHFIVAQPPVNESATPTTSGTYRLAFYGNTPSSSVYGKSAKITMQLTKGNAPVRGKTVERVVGGSGIGTASTDAKGLVSMNTPTWNAGTYKIGGYFTEDSKKIYSVYKTFTVNKAPCTITIDGGTYKKDGVIKFYFKYNNSTPITNTKVQLYVNGKMTSYTTDKWGKIAYKFSSKGTFKFKAVYTGSKNIEKKEFTTTITISE